MNFGKRLNEVRKEKKISQEALAKSVGVHAPVIGRYERDEVKPSIEMATKIATALGTSLDYLVGYTDLKIDSEVLERIIKIQKLNNKDKEHIITTIDALLRDANTRQAYK